MVVGWTWASGRAGGGQPWKTALGIQKPRETLGSNVCGDSSTPAAYKAPVGQQAGRKCQITSPQTLVLVATLSPTCPRLHREGEAHNEAGA